MVNQKGFAPIFILIGIVVLVGILGGAYYIGTQTTAKPFQNPVVSQTPESSPTSSSSSLLTTRTPFSPETVIENFYNSYLNCIENHFQNSNGRSPRENCPFKNSNLSDELVQRLDEARAHDPILCAQDTPVSIKVDQAIIESNKANLTVHTFYEISNDNPIKVALTKGQDGYWQITNITCSL